MNKHKSNKIKENSNTVRHLIMGPITTTQNLVAIKEVQHAGQWKSDFTPTTKPHTTPSWASYVMSTVRIWEKIDCTIMASNCTWFEPLADAVAAGENHHTLDWSWCINCLCSLHALPQVIVSKSPKTITIIWLKSLIVYATEMYMCKFLCEIL